MAGTGKPGCSGDGGPGTLAQMRKPNDYFLDGNGGLLIADIQDQRIRRLGLDTGIMTTFAGDGEKRRDGRRRDGRRQDGYRSVSHRPPVVCVHSKGNTYITERGHRVRKVEANGVMSTFAGTGEPCYGGDGGPASAAT